MRALLSGHCFKRWTGTLALVGAVVAASSCASEQSDLEWSCSESREGCHCELTSSPFAGKGASPRLEQCSYFGCCWALSHQEDELRASCECRPYSTFECAGAMSGAIIAAGATPVDQCPPGAPLSGPPGPACAWKAKSAVGNARGEQRLIGCCEGLVCAPDVEGNQRCRTGDRPGA